MVGAVLIRKDLGPHNLVYEKEWSVATFLVRVPLRVYLEIPADRLFSSFTTAIYVGRYRRTIRIHWRVGLAS